MVAALHLLAETSFSTMVVEQAHASAALLHRVHPQLRRENLCTRSFLHQCRALFSVDRADDVSTQYYQNLQTWLGQQPSRIAGRHVFMKDLFATLRQRLADQPLSREELRHVFSRHAAEYSRLSPHMREHYVALAQREQGLKMQRLREDMVASQSQIALQDERKRLERDMQGLPNSLSSCRLSSSVLNHLLSTVESLLQRPAVLRERRNGSMEAPKEPSDEIKEVLNTFAEQKDTKVEYPTWVKSICKCRELFVNSVLMYETMTSLECGLFLYATQSPYMVVLLPVMYLDDSEDAPASELMGARWEATATWAHAFYFTDLVFRDPAELVQVPGDSVVVFPSVKHLHPRVIVTDATPVALGDLLAGHPSYGKAATTSHAQSQRKNVSATEIPPNLLQEFPWLAGMLGETKMPNKRAQSGETAASSTARPRSIPDSFPEDKLVEAIAELTEKRKTWSSAYAVSTSAFHTELRGGRWTRAVTGKSFDAISAKPCLPESKEWCAACHMPLQASYALQKYGEHWAGTLALQWCSKMQYLFDVARSLPAGQAVTPDILDAYTEDPGYCEQLAALSTDHPARGRAQQIRELGSQLVDQKGCVRSTRKSPDPESKKNSY